LEVKGVTMDLGRVLSWHAARGAVHAGFWFARAGAQALGVMSVAVAYRRAFRMSRDFRRFPA
jgi:hypothetical protein